MIIELAKNYGFCFGVKRAIKKAEQIKDAATIGPLIHNNEEISRLQKNFNVKTLENIQALSNEKKAIISSWYYKARFRRIEKKRYRNF